MKLYEIDEDEEIKKVIAFCIKPKVSGDIAVKLGLTIDTTRREKIPMMVAKHYLIKVRSSAGRVLYKINPDIDL